MRTPNERYASLVAAAGFLPLTLSGDDYLELLPVEWRRITDEGIQIGNRTYNTAALDPHRHQHSGVIAKRGRWEVYYDPYDVSQVHLRTLDGWITAAWTYLPMVSALFADFTWRYARRLAGKGGPPRPTSPRVLDELLTRAEHGPDRAADHRTDPRRASHASAGTARGRSAAGRRRSRRAGRRGHPARGVRRRGRSREVDMSSVADDAIPDPDDPLTTRQGWHRFVNYR